MAIEAQRINKQEEMLGKGLMQPFNSSNSGSRKIMFGTHAEHRLPLIHPEVAAITTGFENRFGEHSTSLYKVDKEYEVLAKIPKYSDFPNHQYYLLVLDPMTNTMDVIKRVSYEHITETYGYLNKNTYLDRLEPGDTIPKGTIVSSSQSYDDYNNHMQGVNLVTAYISTEYTLEDSIILSESGAAKLASPLVKTVSIIVNDNDIPLNLYGNNDTYKIMPDIGEEVNGILCAIRREKKEEALFSQSYERLKDIMMSDDKYTVSGKVVDVRIYCNNPDRINSSYYNAQLRHYYEDDIRFNNEIVSIVEKYSDTYSMEYELKKLYYNAKKVISGSQYIKDKLFSNILMEIDILEISPIHKGDKISDRYGGKGITSIILPDEMMPELDDGRLVEAIFNPPGVVGRNNVGQLMETSGTHIGARLATFMDMQVLDVAECAELYCQYISAFSKDMGNYVRNALSRMSDDEVAQYIGDIVQSKRINVAVEPISENMTIDKLAGIYEMFPFATQCKLKVPITDSNGNTRYIPSRRPIVAGEKYVYRLKQYAEEKFSVTSLSSTNIRNENSRSKASKNYKALYTSTPIRFGDMEQGDLIHMGVETVILILMLYSTSPHGRRLSESLLTGDPFNIDIKLDMDSRNRSVEILNAYLKTMGLRLNFKKVYKEIITPAYFKPAKFLFGDRQAVTPARFIDKSELPEDYILNYPYVTEEEKNGIIIPASIIPARFLFGDRNGGITNEK